MKATLLGWHGRRCEGRSLDPEAAAAALVLCGDADSAVTAAAARMRSADAATPPTELTKLATHPDDEARRNAAAHPRCPTETVGRLAGDPCWAVAFAALDNSRCPHAARGRRRRATCTRAVCEPNTTNEPRALRTYQ